MGNPIFKQKNFWLGLVIVLLIAARMALPYYVLKNLNTYLGGFSPLYQIQIADLDLQLFRMAYRFEGVQGKFKSDESNGSNRKNQKFAEIETVGVALAWRELFHGRVVADVDLDKVHFFISTASLNALAGQGTKKTKDDAKKIKDKTIPFDLERLHVKNSTFEFSDVAGLPHEQNFRLTNIEGVANNLTPRGKNDLSIFSLVGALQEKAKLKLIGQLRLNQDPVDWSMNAEIRKFDLKDINPIAKRMVPITFKEGALTVFAAANSVDGHLQGYVKPFVSDLVLIGDRGDFKGFKHFIFEIAGTIGNFFLKNQKMNALATKVTFKTVNGKVETDTGSALSLAIKNAFGRDLIPALDETLELTQSDTQNESRENK